MSIEYELSLNKLTTPPSYAPRVRPRATIDTPALAAAIASTTSMSAADVGAVLAALNAQIQVQLLAGNQVKIDGIGILTLSLRDRLPTITSPLSPDATLDIGYRADSTLRKNLQANADYVRVEPGSQAPLLLALTAQTGSGLGSIAPGDVLLLTGDRLKVHPTTADEGAYLTPASGPELRITNYLQNTDKQLQFAIPADLLGNTAYTLSIRNRRPKVTTLRETSWPDPITTAA